jgi:hypothetical protein
LTLKRHLRGDSKGGTNDRSVFNEPNRPLNLPASPFPRCVSIAIMSEPITQPISQPYTPLQKEKEEIRLVTIESAEDDLADIQCSLQTAELKSSPTYYALSYVWGDPSVTRRITVGGYATHITLNLYHAMKRLRKRPGTRPLWIDALCVD